MPVDVLFNALPNLIDAVTATVQQAQQTQAAALVPVAQGFAPVGANPRPGEVHLRDTIQVADDDPAAVEVTSDHALFVHQGTAKEPGRPFLMWAADAQRDADISSFSEALLDGARQAGAR